MGLGPTLHSRNKTLATTIKNYPKRDITFLFVPKFASFFSFLIIFCSTLHVLQHCKFWLAICSINFHTSTFWLFVHNLFFFYKKVIFCLILNFLNIMVEVTLIFSHIFLNVISSFTFILFLIRFNTNNKHFLNNGDRREY